MQIAVRLCAFLYWISFAAWGQNAQLHWIENKGQWSGNYDAMARVPGGRVYINDEGFSVLLVDEARLHELHEQPYQCFLESQAFVPPEESIRMHALRFRWLHTHASAARFSGLLPVYYSYFLGNDSSRWAPAARAYGEVSYRNVYQGIDVLVKGWGQHIKYDWIVRAGAEAQQIQYAVEGASGIKIEEGELRVKTALGVLAEGRPVAYQIRDGVRCEVPCAFRAHHGLIGFEFPDGYDRTDH
ncbi:MAG: hypothetical protein ACK5ZY_00560 [Cyclobacteriaceae bacterium]